jgi:hypothetical protein
MADTCAGAAPAKGLWLFLGYYHLLSRRRYFQYSCAVMISISSGGILCHAVKVATGLERKTDYAEDVLPSQITGISFPLKFSHRSSTEKLFAISHLLYSRHPLQTDAI